MDEMNIEHSNTKKTNDQNKRQHAGMSLCAMYSAFKYTFNPSCNNRIQLYQIQKRRSPAEEMTFWRFLGLFGACFVLRLGTVFGRFYEQMRNVKKTRRYHVCRQFWVRVRIGLTDATEYTPTKPTPNASPTLLLGYHHMSLCLSHLRST